MGGKCKLGLTIVRPNGGRSRLTAN